MALLLRRQTPFRCVASCGLQLTCAIKRQQVQARAFASSHATPAPRTRATDIHSRRWGLLASLLAATIAVGVWRDTIYAEVRPEDVNPARHRKKSLISYEELQKHKTKNDLWVAIDGAVYDMTDFIDHHPGGASVVLKNAGTDATSVFKPIHPPNTIEKNLSPDAYKGQLDPATVPEQAEGPSTADQIEERRKRLPPLGSIINLDDFERAAEKVLGTESSAWAYYRSAAEDEHDRSQSQTAYRLQRRAYNYLNFIPRVLRPVEKVDTNTSFLGAQVPLPIYISPAAMARMGHPDGEINLTKAAAAVNGVQGISFNASCSVEEMGRARDETRTPTKEATLWYQIYLNPDRRRSEEALKTAMAQGAKAIILTVDAPVNGKRELDMRTKTDFDNDEDTSVSSVLSKQNEANLRWTDVEWIKKITNNLPVLVKGIQSVEDAKLAFDKGVEGIILSNHGGRQLDSSPAPLATLIRMHLEEPMLLNNPNFEAAVRRGGDVVKALCLGARGVGLGRPFLFAQTCYGTDGAKRLYRIMEEEIGQTMRFIGVTSLKELKPDMLELLDGLVGKRLKSEEHYSSR